MSLMIPGKGHMGKWKKEHIKKEREKTHDTDVEMYRKDRCQQVLEQTMQRVLTSMVKARQRRKKRTISCIVILVLHSHRCPLMELGNICGIEEISITLNSIVFQLSPLRRTSLKPSLPQPNGLMRDRISC